MTTPAPQHPAIDLKEPAVTPIAGKPPAADARLLHEDRQRVRTALQLRNLDIGDFQTPSAMTTLRYVLTVWTATVAIFLAWRRLGGPWLLLLVPCMAVVQHAMLNIVHEASHYSLLRHRRWNDRLANVLAALPIGHTVASYRMTHRDHHAYLRTVRDPSSYVSRPDLTTSEVRRTLVFLLCGRLLWELLLRSLLGRRIEAEAAADKPAMQETDRRRLQAVALTHAPLLAVLAMAGAAGFWLAWLGTLMTLTPTLDGLRTLVEHRQPPGSTRPFHTRSHHRNLLVSGLMAPFFQYHWEHHLFPNVPHHRLADLHRLLTEIGEPGVRPTEGGFFRVLGRLV